MQQQQLQKEHIHIYNALHASNLSPDVIQQLGPLQRHLDDFINQQHLQQFNEKMAILERRKARKRAKALAKQRSKMKEGMPFLEYLFFSGAIENNEGDDENDNNNNLLATAESHKDPSSIPKAILQLNINQQDGNGNTPLHQAVFLFALTNNNHFGNNNNININTLNNSNYQYNDTTNDLHNLTYINTNQQIITTTDIRFLVDNGADINIVNHDGHTALSLAILFELPEIVAAITGFSKVDLDFNCMIGGSINMTGGNNDIIEDNMELLKDDDIEYEDEDVNEEDTEDILFNQFSQKNNNSTATYNKKYSTLHSTTSEHISRYYQQNINNQNNSILINTYHLDNNTPQLIFPLRPAMGSTRSGGDGVKNSDNMLSLCFSYQFTNKFIKNNIIQHLLIPTNNKSSDGFNHLLEFNTHNIKEYYDINSFYTEEDGRALIYQDYYQYQRFVKRTTAYKNTNNQNNTPSSQATQSNKSHYINQYGGGYDMSDVTTFFDQIRELYGAEEMHYKQILNTIAEERRIDIPSSNNYITSLFLDYIATPLARLLINPPTNEDQQHDDNNNNNNIQSIIHHPAQVVDVVQIGDHVTPDIPQLTHQPPVEDHIIEQSEQTRKKKKKNKKSSTTITITEPQSFDTQLPLATTITPTNDIYTIDSDDDEATRELKRLGKEKTTRQHVTPKYVKQALSAHQQQQELAAAHDVLQNTIMDIQNNQQHKLSLQEEIKSFEFQDFASSSLNLDNETIDKQQGKENQQNHQQYYQQPTQFHGTFLSIVEDDSLFDPKDSYIVGNINWQHRFATAAGHKHGILYDVNHSNKNNNNNSLHKLNNNNNSSLDNNLVSIDHFTTTSIIAHPQHHDVPPAGDLIAQLARQREEYFFQTQDLEKALLYNISLFSNTNNYMNTIADPIGYNGYPRGGRDDYNRDYGDRNGTYITNNTNQLINSENHFNLNNNDHKYNNDNNNNNNNSLLITTTHHNKLHQNSKLFLDLSFFQQFLSKHMKSKQRSITARILSHQMSIWRRFVVDPWCFVLLLTNQPTFKTIINVIYFASTMRLDATWRDTLYGIQNYYQYPYMNTTGDNNNNNNNNNSNTIPTTPAAFNKFKQHQQHTSQPQTQTPLPTYISWLHVILSIILQKIQQYNIIYNNILQLIIKTHNTPYLNNINTFGSTTISSYSNYTPKLHLYERNDDFLTKTSKYFFNTVHSLSSRIKSYFITKPTISLDEQDATTHTARQKKYNLQELVRLQYKSIDLYDDITTLLHVFHYLLLVMQCGPCGDNQKRINMHEKKEKEKDNNKNVSPLQQTTNNNTNNTSIHFDYKQKLARVVMLYSKEYNMPDLLPMTEYIMLILHAQHLDIYSNNNNNTATTNTTSNTFTSRAPTTTTTFYNSTTNIPNSNYNTNNNVSTLRPYNTILHQPYHNILNTYYCGFNIVQLLALITLPSSSIYNNQNSIDFCSSSMKVSKTTRKDKNNPNNTIQTTKHNYIENNGNNVYNPFQYDIHDLSNYLRYKPQHLQVIDQPSNDNTATNNNNQNDTILNNNPTFISSYFLPSTWYSSSSTPSQQQDLSLQPLNNPQTPSNELEYQPTTLPSILDSILPSSKKQTNTNNIANTNIGNEYNSYLYHKVLTIEQTYDIIQYKANFVYNDIVDSLLLIKEMMIDTYSKDNKSININIYNSNSMNNNNDKIGQSNNNNSNNNNIINYTPFMTIQCPYEPYQLAALGGYTGQHYWMKLWALQQLPFFNSFENNNNSSNNNNMAPNNNGNNIKQRYTNNNANNTHYLSDVSTGSSDCLTTRNFARLLYNPNEHEYWLTLATSNNLSVVPSPNQQITFQNTIKRHLFQDKQNNVATNIKTTSSTTNKKNHLFQQQKQKRQQFISNPTKLSVIDETTPTAPHAQQEEEMYINITNNNNNNNNSTNFTYDELLATAARDNEGYINDMYDTMLLLDNSLYFDAQTEVLRAEQFLTQPAGQKIIDVMTKQQVNVLVEALGEDGDSNNNTKNNKTIEIDILKQMYINISEKIPLHYLCYDTIIHENTHTVFTQMLLKLSHLHPAIIGQKQQFNQTQLLTAESQQTKSINHYTDLKSMTPHFKLDKSFFTQQYIAYIEYNHPITVYNYINNIIIPIVFQITNDSHINPQTQQPSVLPNEIQGNTTNNNNKNNNKNKNKKNKSLLFSSNNNKNKTITSSQGAILPQPHHLFNLEYCATLLQIAIAYLLPVDIISALYSLLFRSSPPQLQQVPANSSAAYNNNTYHLQQQQQQQLHQKQIKDLKLQSIMNKKIIHTILNTSPFVLTSASLWLHYHPHIEGGLMMYQQNQKNILQFQDFIKSHNNNTNNSNLQCGYFSMLCMSLYMHSMQLLLLLDRISTFNLIKSQYPTITTAETTISNPQNGDTNHDVSEHVVDIQQQEGADVDKTIIQSQLNDILYTIPELSRIHLLSTSLSSSSSRSYTRHHEDVCGLMEFNHLYDTVYQTTTKQQKINKNKKNSISPSSSCNLTLYIILQLYGIERYHLHLFNTLLGLTLEQSNIILFSNIGNNIVILNNNQKNAKANYNNNSQYDQCGSGPWGINSKYYYYLYYPISSDINKQFDYNYNNNNQNQKNDNFTKNTLISLNNYTNHHDINPYIEYLSTQRVYYNTQQLLELQYLVNYSYCGCWNGDDNNNNNKNGTTTTTNNNRSDDIITAMMMGNDDIFGNNKNATNNGIYLSKDVLLQYKEMKKQKQQQHSRNNNSNSKDDHGKEDDDNDNKQEDHEYKQQQKKKHKNNIFHMLLLIKPNFNLFVLLISTLYLYNCDILFNMLYCQYGCDGLTVWELLELYKYILISNSWWNNITSKSISYDNNNNNNINEKYNNTNRYEEDIYTLHHPPVLTLWGRITKQQLLFNLEQKTKQQYNERQLQKVIKKMKTTTTTTTTTIGSDNVTATTNQNTQQQNQQQQQQQNDNDNIIIYNGDDNNITFYNNIDDIITYSFYLHNIVLYNDIINIYNIYQYCFDLLHAYKQFHVFSHDTDDDDTDDDGSDGDGSDGDVNDIDD